MGYKGNKVGVFVYPELSTTQDTLQANGAEKFRMRILANANPGLKLAAMPIQQVIDYDIEHFKLNIRKDFNFQKSLEQQLPILAQSDEILLSGFNDFSAFGAALMK